MARRFEEIEVWQLSRALVKSTFTLTCQEKIRKNFSLADQLQRAALSVMNNISEGFERQSDKEFAYFLKIAKGSAGEVRSMLYVLLDMEFIGIECFNKLYTDTVAISKSLSGFINYLKNKLKST
jgi:four helix bundle protein